MALQVRSINRCGSWRNSSEDAHVSWSISECPTSAKMKRGSSSQILKSSTSSYHDFLYPSESQALSQSGTMGPLSYEATSGDQSSSQIGTSLLQSRKQQPAVDGTSRVIGSVLSPLARALQAQWSLVQQHAQSGSGLARATSEPDLVHLLQRLPAHQGEVMQDAASILPFIVGFAVAPIPSRRSQGLAASVLQDLLDKLVSEMGRPAAEAVLVELFLGEHNALEGIEVAFTMLLADVEADDPSIDDRNVRGVQMTTTTVGRGATRTVSVSEKAALQNRGSGIHRSMFAGGTSHAHDRNSWQAGRLRDIPHSPKEKSATKGGQSCSTLLDRFINILFTAVMLSPRIAGVMLTHVALVKALVNHLLEASPMQASCIASMLHVLAKTATDAPGILAAYETHHVILKCIRAGTRVSSDGTSDVADGMTVTCLYILLEVSILLTRAPGAFDDLYDDDAFALLLGNVLSNQWASVVELSCRWIATLLSHSPQHHGPALVGKLLQQAGGITPVLSGMLTSGDEYASYSLAAATCWRWMLLSDPLRASAAVGEDTGMTLQLIQALLAHPLQSHSTLTQNVTTASSENDARFLLPTEVTISLGLCYLVSTANTRARMRLTVVENLSTATIRSLRKVSGTNLATIAHNYFTPFPVLILGADAADSEDIVISHPKQWHRLLEGAFTDLFAEYGTVSTPSSTGEHAPSPCQLLPRRFMHGSSRPAGPRKLYTSQAEEQAVGTPTPLDASTIDHTVDVSNSRLLVHPNTHRARVLGGHIISARPPPVVQRAELLGAEFYRESLQSVARLAHHYVGAAEIGATGRSRRRASSHPDRSHTSYEKSGQLLGRSGSNSCRGSPSISTIASPRGTTSSRHSRGKSSVRIAQQSTKERNPWIPPPKQRPALRWSMRDIKHSDVLLFVVRYPNLIEELKQAMESVEEHTKHLHRALQLCPIRERSRRCLLNDLYLHVYPKVHLFLRYIAHQAGQVDAVGQLLSHHDGGMCIHSGNVIEMYDAVGFCVGDAGEGNSSRP